MKNNYQFIAPVYDRIVKLVFGNQVLLSQTYFLDQLPEEGNVLFIGGGAGKALKKIVELKPKLSIDYIDSSLRMIQKSQNAVAPFSHQVSFIHGTEKNIPKQRYDAILTFFYLDLFEEDKIKQVVKLLASSLKPKGHWFIADFYPPKSKLARILEISMFLFLKITTNIEASKIHDISSIFEEKRFALINKRDFFYDFIFSRIYESKDGIVIGKEGV